MKQLSGSRPEKLSIAAGEKAKNIMESDLRSALGKSVSARFDEALAKFQWPDSRLFTNADVKSFMASVATQTLENILIWIHSGQGIERIEAEISRLIAPPK